MNKNDYYWFWMNNIKGIGRVLLGKMLDYFSSPEEIYFANIKEVIPFLKSEAQKEMFIASKNDDNIINNYQKHVDRHIRFIHPESAEYPERLKGLPDYPLGLYLKGNLPDPGQKSVSIIGARECTRYGLEMADYFGKELAGCGIPVISGLARGIDGRAHKGALRGNGYTLGILGCGIDYVYPKENYELFMMMEEKGGILSESGLGVKPFAGLFPIRNRLIAGMADGILVIEAMEKSGTFITVDQGLELGKEIFALPGRLTDVKSRGCNNLLKMGAHLVTDVADLLEILHTGKYSDKKLADLTDNERRVEKMLLAPNEKMVYSCLRIEPKYLDDIIKEVNIAPQEVCIILNQLALKGLILETSKNYYAISLSE